MTSNWNKEYRVEHVKNGRTRVLGVYCVDVDFIKSVLMRNLGGGIVNVYHKTGKVVVESFNG